MDYVDIKCTDCRNSLLEDNGYSNYTVEGTEFFCLKGLHPESHFDNFYDNAPELNYAKECTGFCKGAGIHIDVDKDNLAELTEEQKTLLEEFKVIKLLMFK